MRNRRAAGGDQGGGGLAVVRVILVEVSEIVQDALTPESYGRYLRSLQRSGHSGGPSAAEAKKDWLPTSRRYYWPLQ